MCRAHETMLPESGGQSATIWLCLLLVRAPRWCSSAGSNGMRDWGTSCRGSGAPRSTSCRRSWSPEATSGCLCALQERGPSLWCSGGTRSRFSCSAPASPGGSESLKKGVYLYQSFQPKNPWDVPEGELLLGILLGSVPSTSREKVSSLDN